MRRILRQEDVAEWRALPCAPACLPHRIRMIAGSVLQDQHLPDLITLGVVGGQVYIIDGLHRIEAFRASGVTWATAEIRVYRLDSMKEAIQQYFLTNTRDASGRTMRQARKPAN